MKTPCVALVALLPWTVACGDVEPDCPAGTEGCACLDSACDAGLACAADAVCRSERGRRVFVTSRTFTGSLSMDDAVGLEAADRLCQAAADTAGLGGRFVAWLSSDSLDAIDRLRDTGPWRVVGTEQVAFATREALREIPEFAIDRTEGGVLIGGSNLVWTGTAVGGVAQETCGGFASTAVTATMGFAFSSGEQWTEAETRACNIQARLYCFEQ